MREILVKDSEAGQRLDNFLLKKLKGVPKTHVYKMLRKGTIRVNKGRKKPDYRIISEDIVRVPEIARTEHRPLKIEPELTEAIRNKVIFEDDSIMVINKPSGFAVHSGSGLNYGIIDILQANSGNDSFLQLAHRLDRETSGCLIMAKSRQALLDIQNQIKQNTIQKIYLTLAMGQWQKGRLRSELHLLKRPQNSERKMVVDNSGKLAISDFRPLTVYRNATLMEVTIHTGRTHQIRVQLDYLGHPVAADYKYGNKVFNKEIKKLGLKRLFLHARSIAFSHPLSGEQIRLESELPAALDQLLQKL